jgi:hypothetical protein
VLGKRRQCSSCKRRRRVSAWWQDTDKVLCRECAPEKAFQYSLRGVGVTLSWT